MTSIFDVAIALKRHFEVLAETLCDCRGMGDKEPFDPSFHATECPYVRMIRLSALSDSGGADDVT